jgi:hypothetical protein
MTTIRKRLPASVISEMQWEKLLSIARHNPERVNAFINGSSPNEDAVVKADHRGDKPLTIEDLAALFGVDLTKYDVRNFRANQWAVGAVLKDEDGNSQIVTSPLYQSRCDFVPKKIDHFVEILDMIREAREPMLQPIRIQNDGFDRTLAVELCLYDLHIGKEAMEDDWSLEKIREVWWNAIHHLLEDVPLHKVDRWCLPTGNDFLHVDNSKGMTYAGTPVGSGSKWFKSLIFGKELICETVQFLSQYAPVVIPFIQGNHDTDSTMALGELVTERFRDREDVVIMNSSKSRVYWRYGTNLIGYGHGHLVKADKIAQLMAMEEPLNYAATTYRAYHLGHLHHLKQFTPIMDTAEHYKVDVVHVPSLSPKDKWHDDSGFIGSMRRSQSFIYDVEKGLLGSRFFQLK